MNWKEKINEELSNCLKLFPEIETVEFAIEDCEELGGAMGHLETKAAVILMVPQVLQDKPGALRPIILHELSHIISKGSEECERVFNERADEKSKELWKMLKEAGFLICKDTRI